MATQIILVVITLASTIIGTIFAPRPWVKASIILLACSATAGTLLIGYDDHLNKEFIKKALAAQLASAKPTRDFNFAFEASLDRLAKKHDLRGAGNLGLEQGILYFFSKGQSEARVGAATFSSEELGDLFIAYVSKGRLDEVLEPAMFRIPDLKDRENVEKVLNQLVLVGDVVINEKLQWVTSTTAITETMRPDPPFVRVIAEEGSNKVEISIDKDMFYKIVAYAPIERNWLAYQEFEKQLQTTR